MSDFTQSPDSPGGFDSSVVAPTICAATSPSSAKPKRSNHTKPCAPPPGVLDFPDALLRKSHVLFLCTITDNTLARRITDGDFPPPDMVSGRNPLWRVATVRAWLRGDVALDLDRQHAELQRRIADAPTSQERAELLRQHRHLLARMRRLRNSKNTPTAAA
jgi:predicted DNA-binding transcriptional regulator AlpA